MESAVDTIAAMMAARVKPERTGGSIALMIVGTANTGFERLGSSPLAAIPKITGNAQIINKQIKESTAALKAVFVSFAANNLWYTS